MRPIDAIRTIEAIAVALLLTGIGMLVLGALMLRGG